MVDRFCGSPDGNARNLDGREYLDEVLEEMEVERKYSQDWLNAAGALDQIARDVAAAVAAPIAAPVAPAVAANRRRQANRNGGVATRRQPKRACKVQRNYKL